MTMRPKALAALFASAIAAAASPLFAAGYAPYSMTVLVDGTPAPEYSARGRIYVEALKGRNFSLLLTNPTSERVAVALSVDGRNVIDAKRTTAESASKWILMPGQTAEIPGWQISGDTSRRFFFTETRRSYAKWLGDTSNAGTIEAVFYRERRPVAVMPAWPVPQPSTERPRKDAGASSRDEIARREKMADSVEGGVAGDVGGAPAGGEGQIQSREAVTVTGEAPAIDSRKTAAPAQAQSSAQPAPAPRKESDSFAATGIGHKTSFSVLWVSFDEEPNPAARVSLRYEFRAELVRLGVLPREDDLYARDRGRGFDREYAPDPYRGH